MGLVSLGMGTTGARAHEVAVVVTCHLALNEVYICSLNDFDIWLLVVKMVLACGSCSSGSTIVIKKGVVGGEATICFLGGHT